MAKILHTIFEISGKLDGSLMGAIRRASEAMKGERLLVRGRVLTH